MIFSNTSNITLTGADMENAMLRLQEELLNPPFHAILKPVAERVEPNGTVGIRLDYKPEFSGRAGADFFHGGIIAMLVDIAAHAAVAVNIGKMAPTIDLCVDYLRPASTSVLFASACILKVGRSVARASVAITDKDGRLIASGRGAFSTNQ